MKNIVVSFILIFAVNFNYSQEANNKFWESFPIAKKIQPTQLGYVNVFFVTNDKRYLIVEITDSGGVGVQKAVFAIYEYGSWEHIFTTGRLDKFLHKTYSLDSLIFVNSARSLANHKKFYAINVEAKIWHKFSKYNSNFINSWEKAYKSKIPS